MPQFLSSIKLYLVLVLLPQLVYLLTNHYGFAAVCESCSPSTNMDMYIRGLLQDPSSHSIASSSHSSATSSQDRSHLTSDAVCINKDDVSLVKQCQFSDKDFDTDEELTRSRRYSDEHGDKGSLRSLCSCSSKEFSNTSNEEETASSENLEGGGGWHIPHTLPDLTGPCNIKRRSISLSQMDFLKDFAFREPVVLSGVSDQSIFRAHSTKKRLLLDYGDEIITVATANTHSYRKVKMTFCEYVDRYMKPQTLESLGNETFYHFGDNDRERWDPLFSLYVLPPYQLPNQEPVLSFGLAGPGTGVPFHIHGPTFAETIFGRKRWFLYPPDYSPQFHPDVTTLHWVTHTYPNLTKEEKPLECTLSPGEVIYFPDRWWHATLNLDSAVFMSTFYS